MSNQGKSPDWVLEFVEDVAYRAIRDAVGQAIMLGHWPPKRWSRREAVRLPWSRMSVRTRNVLQAVQPELCTLGNLLNLGRRRTLDLRNAGQTTINELDSIMDQNGLGQEWRAS